MRNRFVGAAVSALFPLLVPEPSSAAPQGDGISLAVTLGTDPTEGACGTDTTLSVTAGDQVNYCYTVTNGADETLHFSTLADDVVGTIFTDQSTEIPAGGTYQYNRVAVATTSAAPVSTWTAYDVHPDYVYADNTAAAADTIFAGSFDATAQYAFVDITGTGTNLMLNDDDYTVASIGFPFTFYGQTADALTVSNNGGMLFDQVARGRTGYLSPNTRTLPDRLLGPAILPYWDDLQQDYLDGVGNVFVETDGTAPNRRFIVEWYNLPVNVIGGGYNITLEAILYEGSNQILFQYLDVDCSNVICDNGAAATIGLNSDGTHAILYSYREATVGTGKAILFSPTEPATYTATAQATLDVGAPVITADPGTFSKTVPAGASTTDTLTLGNTGNRPLTWNIGSVGTRSHFPVVPRFALPVGDPSQTHAGLAPVAPSSKRHTPHARGPIGVPAFAADANNARVVSFDANAPSTLTADLDAGGLQYLSGDFIGEDFSTLYAIDFRSFQLYKVDTATGAATLVYLTVPPPGVSADGWFGMAWDASTSTMFAVTAGGRTPVSTLVKLDTETAETTLVGTITGVGDPNNGTVIIDIAIDPKSGNMYGVDIVTDTLVAIDKTTGEASTIGSLGFDANYSEGLDFDDTTGTLYFSGWDNSLSEDIMYTIDTETGVATPISPIGPNADAVQYSALAIARLAGICSYPGDVPWLSYSSTRGSTEPGATTPITVTFDATTLAPGNYSADICVNNNDLTNKRLPVPVALTVQ